MHGLIRALKEHEPLPSYILSLIISVEIVYIFLELDSFKMLIQRILDTS